MDTTINITKEDARMICQFMHQTNRMLFPDANTSSFKKEIQEMEHVEDTKGEGFEGTRFEYLPTLICAYYMQKAIEHWQRILYRR